MDKQCCRVCGRPVPEVRNDWKYQSDGVLGDLDGYYICPYCQEAKGNPIVQSVCRNCHGYIYKALTLFGPASCPYCSSTDLVKAEDIP